MSDQARRMDDPAHSATLEERAAEERRGLLAQLDRTMALLPSPEPSPEPPRGFWRKMFS